MRVDVSLDPDFLGAPLTETNHETISSFVGFLELLLFTRDLCNVHLPVSWTQAYQVTDGPLSFRSRDLSTLLTRILNKCVQDCQDLNTCACANNITRTNRSLVLSVAGPFSRELTCGEDHIAAIYCNDLVAYQQFWRDMLIAANVNSKTVDDHLEHAFSGIRIHNSARDRWDKMGPSLTTIRETLVAHLSYLSDHCASDAKSTGGRPADLIRLAAAENVDMSPENTLSNKARKDRRVVFEGTEYFCLWHTKVTATEGRIHFHILDSGSVLIGVVTKHLSTD